MKCPNCRSEISNSTLRCPYCNYVMDHRYTSYGQAGNQGREAYYTETVSTVYPQRSTEPQYGGYSQPQGMARGQVKRVKQTRDRSTDWTKEMFMLGICIMGMQIINLLVSIVILIGTMM